MSRRTESRQYRLWKRVLQVRLPHPHLTSRNQPLLLFETPYKERLVSQWLAPIQAIPKYTWFLIVLERLEQHSRGAASVLQPRICDVAHPTAHRLEVYLPNLSACFSET